MYCHIHNCRQHTCGCSSEQSTEETLKSSVRIKKDLSEFIQTLKESVTDVAYDLNYKGIADNIEELRIQNQIDVDEILQQVNDAGLDTQIKLTPGSGKFIPQNQAEFNKGIQGFKVPAEFLGLVPNNVGADNSAIWDTIKGTLPEGIEVVFGNAAYYFKNAIEVPKRVTLSGAGNGSTSLLFKNNTSGVTLSSLGSRLKGLSIIGEQGSSDVSAFNNTPGNVGITIPDTYPGDSFIEDVGVALFDTAIYSKHNKYAEILINQVHIKQCKIGILLDSSRTSTTVLASSISACSLHAIAVLNSYEPEAFHRNHFSNTVFIGCRIESSGYLNNQTRNRADLLNKYNAGITISGECSVKFISCKFETILAYATDGSLLDTTGCTLTQSSLFSVDATVAADSYNAAKEYLLESHPCQGTIYGDSADSELIGDDTIRKYLPEGNLNFYSLYSRRIKMGEDIKVSSLKALQLKVELTINVPSQILSNSTILCFIICRDSNNNAANTETLSCSVMTEGGKSKATISGIVPVYSVANGSSAGGGSLSWAEGVTLKDLLLSIQFRNNSTYALSEKEAYVDVHSSEVRLYSNEYIPKKVWQINNVGDAAQMPLLSSKYSGYTINTYHMGSGSYIFDDGFWKAPVGIKSALTHIADKDIWFNQPPFKFAGATFIHRNTGVMYVAAGNLETDPWRSTSKDFEDVTPA